MNSIYLKYKTFFFTIYTTAPKFRVSLLFVKEINTFIQQGCVKLIKSDIYIIRKEFYL